MPNQKKIFNGKKKRHPLKKRLYILPFMGNLECLINLKVLLIGYISGFFDFQEDNEIN